MSRDLTCNETLALEDAERNSDVRRFNSVLPQQAFRPSASFVPPNPQPKYSANKVTPSNTSRSQYTVASTSQNRILQGASYTSAASSSTIATTPSAANFIHLNSRISQLPAQGGLNFRQYQEYSQELLNGIPPNYLLGQQLLSRAVAAASSFSEEQRSTAAQQPPTPTITELQQQGLLPANFPALTPNMSSYRLAQNHAPLLASRGSGVSASQRGGAVVDPIRPSSAQLAINNVLYKSFGQAVAAPTGGSAGPSPSATKMQSPHIVSRQFLPSSSSTPSAQNGSINRLFQSIQQPLTPNSVAGLVRQTPTPAGFSIPPSPQRMMTPVIHHPATSQLQATAVPAVPGSPQAAALMHTNTNTPSPRPSILRKRGDGTGTPGSAAKRKLPFDDIPNVVTGNGRAQSVSALPSDRMRSIIQQTGLQQIEKLPNGQLEDSPRKRMRKQTFDMEKAPEQVKMEINIQPPSSQHLDAFHNDKKKRKPKDARPSTATSSEMPSSSTARIPINLDSPEERSKKMKLKDQQDIILAANALRMASGAGSATPITQKSEHVKTAKTKTARIKKDAEKTPKKQAAKESKKASEPAKRGRKNQHDTKPSTSKACMSPEGKKVAPLPESERLAENAVNVLMKLIKHRTTLQKLRREEEEAAASYAPYSMFPEELRESASAEAVTPTTTPKPKMKLFSKTAHLKESPRPNHFKSVETFARSIDFARSSCEKMKQRKTLLKNELQAARNRATTLLGPSSSFIEKLGLDSRKIDDGDMIATFQNVLINRIIKTDASFDCDENTFIPSVAALEPTELTAVNNGKTTTLSSDPSQPGSTETNVPDVVEHEVDQLVDELVSYVSKKKSSSEAKVCALRMLDRAQLACGLYDESRSASRRQKQTSTRKSTARVLQEDSFADILHGMRKCTVREVAKNEVGQNIAVDTTSYTRTPWWSLVAMPRKIAPKPEKSVEKTAPNLCATTSITAVANLPSTSKASFEDCIAATINHGAIPAISTPSSPKGVKKRWLSRVLVDEAREAAAAKNAAAIPDAVETDVATSADAEMKTKNAARPTRKERKKIESDILRMKLPKKKRELLREQLESISEQVMEQMKVEHAILQQFEEFLAEYDTAAHTRMVLDLECDYEDGDSEEALMVKRMQRIRQVLMATPSNAIKSKRPDFGDSCGSVTMAPSDVQCNSVMKALSPYWRGPPLIGNSQNAQAYHVNRRGRRLHDRDEEYVALEEDWKELYLEDVREYVNYGRYERDLLVFENHCPPLETHREPVQEVAAEQNEAPTKSGISRRATHNLRKYGIECIRVKEPSFPPLPQEKTETKLASEDEELSELVAQARESYATAFKAIRETTFIIVQIRDGIVQALRPYLNNEFAEKLEAARPSKLPEKKKKTLAKVAARKAKKCKAEPKVTPKATPTRSVGGGRGRRRIM